MREIIRPGPGIPAWPSRNSLIRPSRGQHIPVWREIPARPDSPNPAQPGHAGGSSPPGADSQTAQPGQPGPAGARWRRGPAGMRAPVQPERASSRPRRGERPEAQAGRGGLAGRRPTRGAEQAGTTRPRREGGSRPGHGTEGSRPNRAALSTGKPAQPEKVNDPGPAGVLLRCAGPGGHMPAWAALFRPSLDIIRPGGVCSGLGFR
jgi:hypothetical protein